MFWQEYTFYIICVNFTGKKVIIFIYCSVSFLSFLWTVALVWGICSLTHFLLGCVEDVRVSLLTWPRSYLVYIFCSKFSWNVILFCFSGFDEMRVPGGRCHHHQNVQKTGLGSSPLLYPIVFNSSGTFQLNAILSTRIYWENVKSFQKAFTLMLLQSTCWNLE